MRTKLFLTSTIIASIVFSCTTFENPQPIDAKDINSIPSKYHGTYYPEEGTTSLSKLVITKDQIDSYTEKEDRYDRQYYVSRNGLHFIKIDGKEIELFYPSFTKDSVYAKYVDHKNYTLNHTLIIRKFKNTYVANFGQRGSWFPMVTEEDNDRLSVYLISDDVLDKLEKSKEDNHLISENLFCKDFDYYLSRKNGNLELFCELNTRLKQIKYK